MVPHISSDFIGVKCTEFDRSILESVNLNSNTNIYYLYLQGTITYILMLIFAASLFYVSHLNYEIGEMDDEVSIVQGN